jgi:hypothetical protein
VQPCWSGGINARTPTLFTQLYLRDAQNLSGRRLCNQHCEPPQVLSDRGQNKLILGASLATQSQSTELQDALQVREPHIDLLALPSRLLKAFGASVRAGSTSGAAGASQPPGLPPLTSRQ